MPHPSENPETTRASPGAGCPARGDLDAAARGILDPQASARIAEHVATCTECCELLELMRENQLFVTRVLDRYAAADGSRSSGVPALDLPRDLIPGYDLVEELHRGGQGVVYLAVQHATKREVAIKMLLGGVFASERQRLRFEIETELAATLRHSNIVMVHDRIALRGGRYALVMEYIRGVRLDCWLAGQSTARQRYEARLRLFLEVCEAVSHAHLRGVIHRDLKPSNILVDASNRPHLLDFGLAKALDVTERRLTQTGEAAWTLGYASPEQVGDPSRVDARADVYSLGVLLYELLSGARPYDTDSCSIAQAMEHIRNRPPEPLTPRAADAEFVFPRDARIVVAMALEKDPAARYQSVNALAADIRALLEGGPISAREHSTWYVLRKTAVRHRVAVIVGSAVFALVTASAFAAKIQASRLAVALSNGNVERGRARVELGNIPEAQSLLWAELLNTTAGVDRWDPGDARLTLSRAWWALWESYAAHPCAATVRVSPTPGFVSVSILRPVPGRDDLLLIADSGGMMGIWRLPSLMPERRTTVPVKPSLSGGPAGFYGAVIAPGGEIVTVSGGYTVRRFDATTLEARDPPIVLTPPAEVALRTVSLSADGARLAVRDPSMIRILDPRSGSVIETIPCTRNDRSSSLVLSPDGRWVAYAEEDGLTLRQIGAPESAIHVSVEKSLHAMAFAPAEGDAPPRLFFTSSGDILVINANGSGDALRFARVEHVPSLLHLSLSADGRWLAACSEDRRIRLWDTRAPGTPELRSVATHDASIAALTFARDGRSLLSGHADGVVLSWDLSELLSSAAADPSPPPEGSERRAGSLSHEPRGAFTPLVGHTDSIFAVAVGGAAGSARGYSASYDSTVRAWDLESGKETARSDSFNARVESIAISPDGRTIAATIDRGDWADVIFLDARTLREVAKIERSHARRSADLAFSPDGATLASGGDDGFVRLWDVAARTRKAEYQLPDHRLFKAPEARTVRFSPDGRLLAWAGLPGMAGVGDVNLATPTLNLTGNRGTVRCIRFSPDGRHVAGAGNDSTIWVWDAASGRTIHEMKGHVGSTNALDYSPDGRLIASGGSDGSVRLWDARTGDNLAILRDITAAYPRGMAVYALQFTPDGGRLFVGSSGGYLGLWNLRHYDRHIAGNLEYQLDRLKEEGRASPMANEAVQWAGAHKHTDGDVE